MVGCDPCDNVAIWRKLRQHTWWYSYRGGIAAFAISAIDIALWDLKGKFLGQPLVQLLGGAVPGTPAGHRQYPRLSTQHRVRGRAPRQVCAGGRVPGASRSASASADRRDWATRSSATLPSCACLREAIGPKGDIMIDRGQSLPWDLRHAIRLTNAFEEYDLRWIEEPLEPQDIEGFRKLRLHCQDADRHRRTRMERRRLSSG